MMGRIYSVANEVVVWLGKDETDIDDTKWAVDELLPMILEQPEKYMKNDLFG